MNLVPTSLDNTNMPPDKSPIPVACGLLALSPAAPERGGQLDLNAKRCNSCLLVIARQENYRSWRR
jgi:hypothetical protein